MTSFLPAKCTKFTLEMYGLAFKRLMISPKSTSFTALPKTSIFACDRRLSTSFCASVTLSFCVWATTEIRSQRCFGMWIHAKMNTTNNVILSRIRTIGLTYFIQVCTITFNLTKLIIIMLFLFCLLTKK